MYDDDMEDEQAEYASTFEIMINEDCMVSSEQQKIKFPHVDLVVDQHGINKLSDPTKQFDRIQIEPKLIKEMEVLGKGSAGQVRRAVYSLNGKQYVFAVKSINATQQQHRKQLLNDLRANLSVRQSISRRLLLAERGFKLQGWKSCLERSFQGVNKTELEIHELPTSIDCQTQTDLEPSVRQQFPETLKQPQLECKELKRKLLDLCDAQMMKSGRKRQKQ